MDYITYIELKDSYEKTININGQDYLCEISFDCRYEYESEYECMFNYDIQSVDYDGNIVQIIPEDVLNSIFDEIKKMVFDEGSTYDEPNVEYEDEY